MLLPQRPLRARTFRLGAGQTIAIGGVARVDVRPCPAFDRIRKPSLARNVRVT